MRNAYTLIVAVAMAPCIAVLWHQDALGTLLATVVAIVIGTFLPQRPVRRVNRAAVRPVQVRESFTRHLGATTARGFLSKA